MFKLTTLIIVITVFFGMTGAYAQSDLPQDKANFFEKNIRPALIKYCYECHSRESGKTKGGLLLDSREGVLQGGDSGPALIPAHDLARRARRPRPWDRHLDLAQAGQQLPHVGPVPAIATAAHSRIPFRAHQRFQFRLEKDFETRPDRAPEHRSQILLHVLLRHTGPFIHFLHRGSSFRTSASTEIDSSGWFLSRGASSFFSPVSRSHRLRLPTNRRIYLFTQN